MNGARNRGYVSFPGVVSMVSGFICRLPPRSRRFSVARKAGSVMALIRRNHRAVWLVLLLGLAGPTLARATTLAQLRAQLQGSPATAPLSAQVTLRNVQVSGKKKHPKVVKGSIVFHIEDDASGLAIRLPADVLAQAGKENAAQARDADAPAPTRSALQAIDPVLLGNMADFAPRLRQLLIGVSLTGQRDVTRDGRRLHEMTFSVPLRINKAIRKTIDDYQGTLTVWLDASGRPVGVYMSRVYKGSKFLIRFSFFTRNDYQLQTIGKRLVVRHVHTEQGGSGLGRGTKRTLDITLEPASAD